MRVKIFGATGPTGLRLLERAIAEGHEVTAFARDPSKLEARHERLVVARGDAFDAGDVEGAVAGAEAVISSVRGGKPSNPLRPSRSGDPNGPASAGAGNIVAAMKKHGVGRLVCQTAWGVGESKEKPGPAGSFFMNVLMPLFLRDEYADKEAAERTVKESGLDWTIVRPMILTNGAWTNAYRATADLKPGRRFWISRADVADFLLKQLSDGAFLREAPAIGYR